MVVAKVEIPVIPFEVWRATTMEPLIERTDAIAEMEKLGATAEDIELFFRRVQALAPQTLL